MAKRTHGQEPSLVLSEGTIDEPLWIRAEKTLEAAVHRGNFGANGQLPNEEELAARLHLHRHTVRRAVKGLVERGILEIRRGRGTFVAGGPIPYVIGPRSRFTENIKRSGRTPSSRLISSSSAPANPEEAQWLKIKKGEPILRLSLLRLADDVPIVFARHSMPAKRFPDFEARFREIGSITLTYATYGTVGYTRHATRIAARLPVGEESELLKVPRGAPLLAWTSVNLDKRRVPINLDDSTFAASRINVVIEHF
jgi:GntR family phosphonate transport system transcriptional regulator